jgi:hypothetical protein
MSLALPGVVRADFNPVPLTQSSYTFAIVVPSNSPAALPYCITASQGGGTNESDSTWFEAGYWRSPNTNIGLPSPGVTFTDQSNPNVSYIMPASYLTNNGLLADSTVPGGGTLTLAVPTTCVGLTFLGVSGGGGSSMNYTVTHQDTSTETGAISYNDWFNGTPYAFITGGRVGTPGGGEQNNGANPRLYSAAITVSSGSPVVSIGFTYGGSGGHPAVYAVSTSTDGTTFTPAVVSGFNEELIVPKSFPLTATMDQGTNTVDNGNLATWFESGYVQNNTNWGIPTSGSTFNSQTQPSHHYQMGNYSTNCAILIDSAHRVENITPASLAPYNAFAFLTAGGNVGGGNRMTNICVFQHQDGVQETNIFIGYDWFEGSVPGFIAFKANGRVNMHDRTVNNVGNQFPYMFETYFALTDTTSPVTNIVLKYGTSPSANSTTYIMAVSATAGGIPPVISTQPTWVNAFPGTATSFNFALGSGTAPLVYQWQKAPAAVGPYTNLANVGDVSGVTTTNLSFSSVTAADNGWYTAVITNTAGAATSSPVMLYVLTSTNSNITLPIDAISDASFGNIIPSNPGEGVSNVVDRTTDKYLTFGQDSTNVGGAPFQGPVGFVLTPSQGSSVVSALRIRTDNDAPERDPADIMLEGSTDGGSTYTTILPDTLLALPQNRNAEGLPLDLTNQPLEEVDFVNTNAYTTYRVTIENVRSNAIANSMGVAEIEFLGTLTGPPTIASNLPAFYQFLAGFPFQLSVPVGGSAPITYGWYYNGSPLSNGGRISGANSSVLTVADAQLSDSGTYQLFATNSLGTNSTSVESVTVVPVLGFNGFGDGWSANGNATYNGSNSLEVTTGAGGQASSSFYENQVYVGGFEATWTYEDFGGGGADGTCFVIQTNGVTALGGGGGELGVTGISPSAEVEFNIYSGNGVGGPGVTFATNGIINNIINGSGFIADGDPIAVSLTYLNGTVSLVVTDVFLATNFSISLPVNIPATVGSTMAYVGFTGGDGGIASTQQITDFNYVPIITLSVNATSPTTAVLSWPTGVGAYVLQSSPSLVSPTWTNVGNPVVQTSQLNSVTVSTTGPALFYQLHVQYTPE